MVDHAKWKDIAEAIQALVTTLAIIIGGIWAYFRFRIQRERYARLEFNLDLSVLGNYADKILIEAIAIVENKGLVRHWVNDFRFDLHYLPKGGKLTDGDERINHQVLFQPVIKKRYWIPPSWINTFIDAGVKQRYTYVTHVPSDTAFILLYAQFKYPDTESEYHTSQKVFRIDKDKSEESEANGAPEEV